MINQHNTTQHLVLLLLALLYPCFSFSQDCSYNGKANDIIPDGKCAPVGVVWEVTYRDVDDLGTGNVQIQYDWDDGNAVETVNATLTNASLKEWSTTLSHTYPNTGNQCNYHPRATLIINGVTCTSSTQEQIVTVWDTDDQNGGYLAITPDPKPICLGNDALFNFTDNSQWNCTPPDEEDDVNNEDRWIQWIYGTGGTTIIDAQVDGAVRSYPYSGDINYIAGPIEGPTSPYNTSLDIYIPDYYNVGDFFEVTLRNWNTCNPYDDPDIAGTPTDLINGDYDPVTTTAMAIIVALPDATIQPVASVCESEDPFLLIATDGGGTWSGPGITSSGSGLFDPASAGPGIHTITYSITDTNGCEDIGTINIEVLESPIANIAQGDHASLCPGITITIDGNPSLGQSPYTHLWKGDTSALDDTGIVNPEFSTLTTGTYQLIYHVTDANNCYDEDTITIDIDEINISFINDTIETCLGATTQLDPSPTGGSGTFVFHQWTGSETAKLSDTSIQNPWFSANEVGTFDYTYTVRDDYGCENSTTLTIIVHQQPIANAGVDIEECSLQTTLSATPSVGNGTWEVINGPGTLFFSDFNISNPQVTADTYGSYTLHWIEDNNSCKDTSSLIINFTETPAPSVMQDKDTCGFSMELIAFPHVGTGSWSMSTGPGNASFSDINNDTTKVSVDTAGAYTFRYTEDNGGCSGYDEATIYFYQTPTANLTPPDSVSCTPYAISFENTSTNADTYHWDFDNGNTSYEENPTQTFINNTQSAVDYTITLITSTNQGCSDTIETSIKVAPSPISYFSMNNSVGCSPLTTTFTNQSQGGDSYEWIFDDGSDPDTTENNSHIFINNENYVQSYKIMLVTTNSYSCADTSKMYTSVYPKQDFNLTASPDSGCSPLNVSLVADAGAYIYNWDIGDGNIDQGSHINTQVFTNTSNNKETHTVSLYTTSIYGCQDTAEITLTILPSPTTSFEPNDVAICSPKEVLFTNNTANIETSYWDFGDGTEQTVSGNEQVSHTYTNNSLVPLNYKIQLITENSFGCTDSMDGFTSVNPAVTATISGDTISCSPLEATFSNTSIGANSYYWEFGDGNTSGSIIGQNSYVNTSNESEYFTVRMIANSVYGCSDTAYTEVTVLPSPTAYFEPNDFSVCSPKEVTFTNYTENITTSYWSFGDGTLATTDENDPIVHTYTNDLYTPLDYRIRLITENSFGCRDSMDGYTSVNPNVTAVISGSGEGCAPLELSLGNESVGGSSFTWDYGDGNNSSNYLGYNIFYNDTNEDLEYQVSLIAKSIYGCSDTAYTKVKLLATPNPAFTVSPAYQQMPESTVELVNTTAGELWSYEWDFNDESTSTEAQPTEHTYQNSGEYTITLRAYSNYCENTTEQTILIDPNIPTVSYGPSSEGCPSLTIEFYSQTTDVESYLWEFGDGNISAEPNPTHTYYSSGEYTVTLTVTGPGGQTIKDDLTINVYPEPTALFEAYPKLVTIPGESVTFVNTSVDADTYSWDFGDGYSSTEENPIYEYKEEGSYTVSLEVTNEYGCTDSYELNESIIAEEGGSIAFPNAFTPNTSSSGTGEYDYGNKNNYIFYPAVQEGIAEYKLQIFSRWGQLLFESNDISIGWNGYHNGKICAQGVYIWKATCRFGTGQVKVYTGDVTLLR